MLVRILPARRMLAHALSMFPVGPASLKDYQHAIVLSMIEDTLPNIRENLFPTFFSDSAVQMVFPNTTAIGVPIQS